MIPGPGRGRDPTPDPHTRRPGLTRSCPWASLALPPVGPRPRIRWFVPPLVRRRPPLDPVRALGGRPARPGNPIPPDPALSGWPPFAPLDQPPDTADGDNDHSHPPEHHVPSVPGEVTHSHDAPPFLRPRTRGPPDPRVFPREPGTRPPETIDLQRAPALADYFIGLRSATSRPRRRRRSHRRPSWAQPPFRGIRRAFRGRPTPRWLAAPPAASG